MATLRSATTVGLLAAAIAISAALSRVRPPRSSRARSATSAASSRGPAPTSPPTRPRSTTSAPGTRTSPQAPLDPRLRRDHLRHQRLGGDLHPDFGSPRAVRHPLHGGRQASAKRVKVKFTAYGDESDHGKYRVPLNAPVEGGASSDGDRHVLVYDKKRCKLYELYRAFPQDGKWKPTSGAIWDLRSAGLRTDGCTSADAAGLPIFPGLVRYDEAARRPIDHAIRLTFAIDPRRLDPPGLALRRLDTPRRDAPAMGMRLRLRSGYDLSGFAGPAPAIAQALKQLRDDRRR